MTIPMFHRHQYHRSGRSGPVILKVGLVLLTLLSLAACGFSRPPSLQEQIRHFFHTNQAKGAELFVDWADSNLTDYSNSTIFEALYIEGQHHASLGHPNAISIINYAAEAWAQKKRLKYNEDDWLLLHEEAVNNMKQNPVGEIKFWTD